MLISWEDFYEKPPCPPTTTSALGVDVELQRVATSNRKSKNKTRFSDEQIRLLESMFETESRPELALKRQMAIQLGLQPRQVAIWFQNKRARSKSTQIEHDLYMLKIRYTTLASKFELLKKENQSLCDQLQGLRSLLGRPRESIDSSRSGSSGKIRDNKHDNQDIVAEEKPKSPLEAYNLELGILSKDNNMEYFDEETSIQNTEELVEDYFTSTISGSFESGYLLEYSSILDI